MVYCLKWSKMAFMFNSNEMERVESYKYVVFEFHATKNLAHITSQLARLCACLCCKTSIAFHELQMRSVANF